MKMRRQPPLIRAGSGDSHEARLAVLEQRFSEAMQARCSWCNQIRSAKQGAWLEVLISTPGTGVTNSHVFRCLECESTAKSVGPGIVTVPRASAGATAMRTKAARRAAKAKDLPALPKISPPAPTQEPSQESAKPVAAR